MTNGKATVTPAQSVEVELNTAIAGTSANTNDDQVLGLTVSDPPPQSEIQAIADKIDELITAMRRRCAEWAASPAQIP